MSLNGIRRIDSLPLSGRHVSLAASREEGEDHVMPVCTADIIPSPLPTQLETWRVSRMAVPGNSPFLAGIAVRIISPGTGSLVPPPPRVVCF